MQKREISSSRHSTVKDAEVRESKARSLGRNRVNIVGWRWYWICMHEPSNKHLCMSWTSVFEMPLYNTIRADESGIITSCKVMVEGSKLTTGAGRRRWK